MIYQLIDQSLLLPETALEVYPDKYNTIPLNKLTEDGKTVCEAFGQTIAPMTILAQDGMFQRVLPAFCYPGTEATYNLCWVAGVDIPLVDVRTSVDILDDGVNKACKLIVVETEAGNFAFHFRKENPLSGGGGNAGPLYNLDLGEYKLTGIKKIRCSFGDKLIVRLDGAGEFWSNSGLTNQLHISNFVPKEINSWLTPPIPLTLVVLDKEVTAAGKNVARVGLRKA